MRTKPIRTTVVSALACLAGILELASVWAKPAMSGQPIGHVTPQRLLGAPTEPGEWFTGGRDYQQSYYSPLDQINKHNVKQLGFAWSYDIASSSRLEATPIVVDGVMFTSGNKGMVYALDARTGAERWVFDPHIDLAAMRLTCCGPVNRGVAVWRGSVYVGSLDGYLYALSADTGVVLWKVDTIVDRSRAYTITGAPYIAKGLVVIGNGGADLDARGYITAYEVKTGKLAWRFFIVPGDPKKDFEHAELLGAVKTWDPNSLWEVGGGGTAWDAMAYDPKLNLLYVGTGNAIPFPRKLRSPAGGDNLFLSSILALNPDTGRLIWYYQTVPGENWDYTATQKMILAELKIDGRARQVIMQAPKNGFFYVLDRKTGELLSARPYVYVNWASHVDLKTGRPVETGQGDYSEGPKLVFPSTHGGHNWHPMAYNLKTGLVYIPAIEMAEVFGMRAEPFSYTKQRGNSGVIHFPPSLRAQGRLAEITKHWPSLEALSAGQPDYRPRTFLRAWDPVRQRLVWEVETTDDSGLGSFATSGVMTTAGGLVFQGRNNMRELDKGMGRMAIFDADSGAQLYSIDVGETVHAAPMSYEVDRKQYLAFMEGGRSGGRIVALKLGGGVVPKSREVEGGSMDSLEPPISSFGTPAQIARGAQLFQRNCEICHADASRAPDLTKMSKQTHREFLDIVLGGIRAEKGMGSFKGVLSEEDVQAIHAYLTATAARAPRHQLGS